MALSDHLRRIMPPWLRRRVASALVGAIGEQVDLAAQRAALGVRLRFPAPGIDGRALAYIGRERRIRRGPVETDDRYARRLLLWWSSHRGRGGPYALLEQVYAYTLGWLTARVDVVYQSGTRYLMDTAGEIERNDITWGGNGSDEWAHVWVVFHVPSVIPIGTARLVTSEGDYIVDHEGNYIVVTRTIAPGDMTDGDAAVFTSIVREWSAAHLPYITVVLLWETRRLWSYPQPVPTWSEWAASGALWGDSPVTLRTE